MTQTRPFTKLKKQIESLFVPELKMKVNCISYPIRSQYGSSSLPRFYVQLGRKTIWDFPKDFPLKEINYHYWKDRTGISELIREYIDTPLSELPKKIFLPERVNIVHHYLGIQSDQGSYDFTLGLTDMLKAADRRLGKERLLKWASPKNDPRINYLLLKRFGIDLTINKQITIK